MKKLLLSLVLGASSLSAIAQDYPTKPVRIVVSQAAGASIDIQARIIAERLSKVWGQQVYVENKPGANGIIGMQEIARAKPDGYTLGTAAPSAMTSNQYIYKDLPYKPAEDFIPITQVSGLTFALVAKLALAANSVPELVNLGKQKPNDLTYSSPGIGNLAHLAAELFVNEAGIKVRHIPAKGDTGALNDLVTGNTDFMISTLPAMLPHIKSGRLKLLAIAGPNRSAIFPDTRTIAESGYPQVLIEGWVGMVAPAGTPPGIVSKVQQEVARLLQSPDLKEVLAKQGSTPVGSTPEVFAAFIKAESSKWQRVVKLAGIQPN